MDTSIVRRLLDKVSCLAESNENQRRRRLWGKDSYADQWRGIPTRELRESGTVPITIGIEYSLWAKLLGFDLVNFYTNPVTYLESQLRIKIYKFQHFRDDTPLDKTIYIFLGTSFEVSLFGIKTIYKRDQDPWIDHTPVVSGPHDIPRLRQPDFDKSGLMPLAHRMYETISNSVSDDFLVVFPTFMRGPFGVAVCLRGLEEFLTDMLLHPDYAHGLLEFATKARKRWDQQRARFLRNHIEIGMLDNDDVNTPTISPSLYEDFVLPCEKDMSDFYGGISYWHSCGDITPLLTGIRQIPGIEMLHLGPWTDISRGRQVFGESVPLEICLHPVRDIYGANEEQMRSTLRRILRESEPAPITIRADTFQRVYGVGRDIAKIQRWITVAREELKP